jgi:hypothetical protein
VRSPNIALETQDRTLESTQDNRKQKDVHRPTILISKNPTAEKHILRMKCLLEKFDSQKKLYPNGLLSELELDDSNSDSRPLKRIELFAKNERSNETFGVIRSFFVGFSFERGLLELANFSNNVISVRAVSTSQDHRKCKVIEDKLVLKRIENRDSEKGYSLSSSELLLRRNKVPSLIVSSRWMDRMELSSGDRIIVSNPVESYMTPPPELVGAK